MCTNILIRKRKTKENTINRSDKEWAQIYEKGKKKPKKNEEQTQISLLQDSTVLQIHCFYLPNEDYITRVARASGMCVVDAKMRSYV